MEKRLPVLFHLALFFTFFELAAGRSFHLMELSLLLLLGAAALSAKYLWERKCLLRPLTDYWLFWGFSLYLFLDALGALAPADWALSYEKYRVVGLMAVLTLLGALLLDSREAIDRVFATLALAAVAAALLSVLGRMGAGPFPSEYDLRLSLRRDYNMFAVTILLGWSGGAFLLLRQGVSAKNRGILLLIAGVCLPPVLLSGSRRAVLLFLPIGLLVTGTALVRGWKAGKLLSAIGGTVLAFSLVAALTIAGSSLLQNLPEQAPGLPGGGGETELQDRYETIAEGSFLSKRRILWRIAWEEYSGYPPFEKLTGQGLGRDVVLYRESGDQELCATYPQAEQREALSAHNFLLSDLLSGGYLKAAAGLALLLALLVDGLTLLQKDPARALPYGVILGTAVLQNAVSGRYGFLYDKWFFFFSFLLLRELSLIRERGRSL